MRTEVNNKPQTNGTKNDKKTKQEIAAAFSAQQPNVQQNTGFIPQGNRYIRSWVEGSPEPRK